MGCSATNVASDLSERASNQALLRDELIARLMTEEGVDRDTAQIQAQLRQARGVLKTLGHQDSPDAERYGAPVPMFVRGEVYQTTEVDRRSDGSIVRQGVTWNGPLMKRVKVREEPEGGDFTRVVAEAR